jgi:hypothetical protein
MRQHLELVECIAGGFAEEAHPRADRQQPPGRLRRLPAVTPSAEIDLGRVDLHEPEVMSVAEGDCVPVDDVVDAIDR